MATGTTNRPKLSPELQTDRRRDGRELALPLILLLGAGLRIPGLARFPFEQDELYTAVEAEHLFRSPLHPGIEARPLYYLLQHPLLELWPVAHVPMRVLPFLFGMLGIWVTWLLARKLFGWAGATAAGVLVALSPWHIYASDMARYWSLVYLLATTAVLLLLRAYESDRPRHFLPAFLVLVAGGLTHPTFVFTAAGVALGLSLVRDDGSLGWRWPTRNAWAFLWLPFLAAIFAEFAVLRLTGEQDAIRNWGGRGLLGTLRLLPAIVEGTTPILFAAGGFGALVTLIAPAGRMQRRWGAAAIGGVVAALTLLVIASSVTDVYAGYAISILPLVIVSAGGLVAWPLGRSGIRAGAFVTIATLIFVAGMLPSTVSHLSDGARFDYRPAFSSIAASAAPDAPLLVMPITIQRHYAPALRGIELQMSRDFLEAALREHAGFWAIIPVRRYGVWQDSTGEVANWVAGHCRLRGSHQRPRLDYRIHRTDLYWCGAEPG